MHYENSLMFRKGQVSGTWLGSSGSCRLSLSVKFKMNAKKLERGSLRFFSYSEINVSQ